MIWNPAITAPTGRELLLAYPSGRVSIGNWHKFANRFVDICGEHTEQPLYWAELPAPPSKLFDPAALCLAATSIKHRAGKFMADEYEELLADYALATLTDGPNPLISRGSKDPRVPNTQMLRHPGCTTGVVGGGGAGGDAAHEEHKQ